MGAVTMHPAFLFEADKSIPVQLRDLRVISGMVCRTAYSSHHRPNGFHIFLDVVKDIGTFNYALRASKEPGADIDGAIVLDIDTSTIQDQHLIVVVEPVEKT